MAGSSGDVASSSHRYGLRERDGRIYIEIRAGDAIFKNYKIVVSGFGGNIELMKMACDAAMWCNLGEAAYLELVHTKLHYHEKRQILADRFREDNRMADLANLHRAKRAAGEFWTRKMKETLRELAADALQWMNDTEQGAPAPQPGDSGNTNGNCGSNFVGLPSLMQDTYDLGLIDSRWPFEFDLEDPMFALRPINETTPGAAAAPPVDIIGMNRNIIDGPEAAALQPVYIGMNQNQNQNQGVQAARAPLAAALLDVAPPVDIIGMNRNIIDGPGAAALQPVYIVMNQIQNQNQGVQAARAPLAAALLGVAPPVDIIDRFDIDGGIGPEDGAAPKNWPYTKEAQQRILRF